MEDNLDPGLKPYMLSVSTDIASIFTAINHVTDAIDKMANTGAIRATEARTMSGISREVEFSLLNAKLAEISSGLELAEEQLWTLFAQYQGRSWTGSIDYPGSFNIRDTQAEIDNLVKAKSAATDARVLAVIDHEIVEYLGEDADNKFSELKIVELPNDVEWRIHEYDGMESVAEIHRTWS